VELQAQEAQIGHQREMFDLMLKQQKQQDDLVLANEKLRNELTEMELKYNGRECPGSRV
jgi:hypothetical protein